MQQRQPWHPEGTTPLPLHFGALLKMLRDRDGITQIQVLKHLPGWQQPEYSKVEKDKRAPIFDHLVPIYTALARAGVRLTLQDRRQFVLFARRKIESMKTRHEHKDEGQWEQLRHDLAEVDRLPVEGVKANPIFVAGPHSLRPHFIETRHLIGREAWLAHYAGRLEEQTLKVLILQGPVGIGLSSEMCRLAKHFLRFSTRYTTVFCELPPVERQLGPESALDMLLSEMLSEVGQPDTLLQGRFESRIAYVLSCLERAAKPVLIFVDNAENIQDQQGLAWSWERLFRQFLNWQHQATLVVATKEWGGWFEGESIFVERVTVPPLEREAGVILLQRAGLQDVEPRLLEAIHQAGGGVPQFLKWMALLAQNRMTLDSWEMFDEDEVSLTGTPSSQSLTQRIERLLHDPGLLGGSVATKLKPLLDRVEQRLSSEARQLLYQISVASIALGKPAVRALCPRPSLLQEISNASLLVAYDNRIQVLPLVSTALRSRLSSQQRYNLEEHLASAVWDWLMASHMLSLREMGAIVTELAEIFLKHHRLLDAAQFVIRHAWLSFKIGHARRLAQMALKSIEEVQKLTVGQSDVEQRCGSMLLFNFLAPFLGHKLDAKQRMSEYHYVRQAVMDGTITLQPPIEVAVTHHLIHSSIHQLHFEEALDILEACCNRLQPHLEGNPDLAASLLEKRAWLFGRWGEYAEETVDQAGADDLQEQTIALNRQIITLLADNKGQSALEQVFLKKRLARALNNLAYHLNRIGSYEQACQAMEQSIEMKEQGYAEMDTLADAYGDHAHILANLGRFQEALMFDGKAFGEIQRLAEAGYIFAQAELPTYQISRGCLYLRLGKVDEAEHLLRGAEPRVQPERRMYQMFAQQAMSEIVQWRTQAGSSHYQLDWRWVERYRQLAAFDSYWWWTPAGPFNDEELRQWDQLFSPQMDDDAKEHLGAILAASREREFTAALAEQREPHFFYPTIAIDEVRDRIAGLMQLAAEIRKAEPNGIVRRFYQETIEEELDFLRMIEATHEGNTKQYWECSVRLTPLPTHEEMNYTISRVRHYILQGLLQPEVEEASQQVLRAFERIGIGIDVSHTEEEAQELRTVIPLSTGPRRLVSAQTAKRFFEAALHEGGFEEWKVVIDPNASSPRVEQGLQCIYIPENRIALQQIKSDLSHELAGHVARCIAGERSLIGLLGIHTARSLEIEEGLATYYEIDEARQSGQPHDETGVWLGTLAVGLASGVMTSPQTFLSLFHICEAFIYLYRLLRRPDQNKETAQKFASRLALARCIRTFRGVPDLTQAGVCYTKDALYLTGLRKIEQAVAEDKTILDRLAVGVIGLEQLPYLAELGIISASQPLRHLAQRLDLDEYILSFESAEMGK